MASRSRRKTATRSAPRKAAPRRAAPWFEPLLIGGFVMLLVEQALALLYPQGHHLIEQRRTEVYGWLSMAALLLVLAARWLRLMPYRRALGLAAFGFAVVHTWLAYVHVLDRDVESVLFLSVEDQAAIWVGVVALLGLLPLALTSTNAAMRRLGKRWKTLHQLGPVMSLLAAGHTAWIGVHFGLNPVAWTSVVLVLLTAALFLFRSRPLPVPGKKVNP